MRTIQQQIFEAIDGAKRILITFSSAWPGDAVASALALRLWLLKLGKEADIAAEKPTAASPYAFLPGFALIKPSVDNLRKFIISLDITNAEVGQIEYEVANNKLDFIISPKNGFFTPTDISSRQSGYKYDLILVLSTPDLESLGSIYDTDTAFFFETSIINIDHRASNDNYGQMNFVNVNAVASAEMLYELFKLKDTPLDPDIATCLLTGLIAETKSFKTANVTPRALTIASELVEQKARREEIINVLYRSRQLNVLKLWGSVLLRLRSAFDNRIIYSTVKSEDFIATETRPEDLVDIIDDLIVSMPLAQLIILAYEIEEASTKTKTTKALIYSVKNFDALLLAQPLPAEGTKASATVQLSGELTEAAEKFVAQVEDKIRRLES